jgi:hypothetical protein
MSEWFKVPVLKTGVSCTVGSNPTLSVLLLRTLPFFIFWLPSCFPCFFGDQPLFRFADCRNECSFRWLFHISIIQRRIPIYRKMRRDFFASHFASHFASYFASHCGCSSTWFFAKSSLWSIFSWISKRSAFLKYTSSHVRASSF